MQEGEFAPTNPPTRPGSWSIVQLNDIIQTIIVPFNPAHSPSSFPARSRGSRRQTIRCVQTRWYRTRMAFLPLFLFLIRYGFRPIDASAILVRYWNRTLRCLELPPKLNNKRRPHGLCGFSDRSVLDFCARDQDPDAYLFRPVYTRRGGRVRPKWTTGTIGSVMRRILDLLPGTSYWCRYTALTNLCEHFGRLR